MFFLLTPALVVAQFLGTVSDADNIVLQRSAHFAGEDDFPVRDLTGSNRTMSELKFRAESRDSGRLACDVTWKDPVSVSRFSVAESGVTSGNYVGTFGERSTSRLRQAETDLATGALLQTFQLCRSYTTNITDKV